MTSRAERPMLRAMLDESRTVLAPVRLVLGSRRLLRRAEQPTSIIVLPGFGANDASTLPLRGYLRSIGHRVEGWRLGVQGRDVAESVRRFGVRLDEAADATGGPATLVGWSLGGVVAREAARIRPDLVQQVITLGSPIVGRPAGAQRPIRVPVTCIYSRRDGIVGWRDAIDNRTPGVVNIEVDSSHLGLGVDPDVWRIIAERIDELPEP